MNSSGVSNAVQFTALRERIIVSSSIEIVHQGHTPDSLEWLS